MWVFTRLMEKSAGDVRGSSKGEDRQDLKDHLKAISPVPGGIGPLTIAMLLKNCFELAKKFGKSN